METPGSSVSDTILGRLLIVDDDVSMRTVLCDTLTLHGYDTLGVTSGKQALEALRAGSFDVMLTDLVMPEMDGIALLTEATKSDPYLVGIVMTGHATVETAVGAMKVGAFDYVLKPFKLNALLPTLARAIEVRRLRLENVHLREMVARTLRTLSKCNEVLVRATGETDLLHQICRIVVEEGGYLATLPHTWADDPRARNPAGIAMQSEVPCIMKDIRTEADLGTWRGEALRLLDTEHCIAHVNHTGIHRASYS